MNYYLVARNEPALPPLLWEVWSRLCKKADMALWNSVGQVANLAQLTGLDAYGLISMIVEAAKTVKRNRETCQLLARRVRMIGDLLEQLQSSQLMQYLETRNPMEQLEEALRHAYIIMVSCQQRSYLYSCFLGGKQAEQLREVQNDITFHLQLFPLVSFVDTSRTLERVRDHPSCSEVTADGLHKVHDSEFDDRLSTMDLEATKFNSPKESGEKQTGQVMDIGELANVIGGDDVTELLYFSSSRILVATKKFSKKNLIGSGAFGDVYKGKLSNGLDIAVKRQNTYSCQGPEQFRTEMEAIPKLKHKNIITLLGCCIQGGEKILVYEYMPNKSLASMMSDETKRESLKWCKRLQIIKAVAEGLAYLHGHPHMCIVHRDIKSSNILLDREMNAKISDFGLAIMLPPNTTAFVTVVGTGGYVDPTYAATGLISEKADVYSFGVLLLEVISGKPVFNVNGMNASGTCPLYLPDYAHKYRKKLEMLVDPLLYAKWNERGQIMECLEVALLCTQPRPEHRPTMSRVVTMLHSIDLLVRRS